VYHATRQYLKYAVVLDEKSRPILLYNPKRSASYSVLISEDGSILRKHDDNQSEKVTAIERRVSEVVGR
jgi:hypothetical protein